MRPDMSKVIVERPRRCAGRLRNRPAMVGDVEPRFLGTRRDARERGGEKELNENLQPLFRYLDSQVGRPWNKVFSEIAANLRPTSTVQKHVLDHLWMMVSVGRFPVDWRGGPDFYVEPRTGLLRRNPRSWRFRPKRAAAASPLDQVRVAPLLEHRRLNGLWYEVRLAPLPGPVYRSVQRKVRADSHVRATAAVPMREVTVRQLETPAVWDVVARAAIKAGPETDDERAWADFRKAHPERVYAVAKRQLSRGELRKHGRRNDPA